MAKLWNYVFLTVGLMVLFNAAGLNTTESVIIRQLGVSEGEIQNFTSSAFWIAFAISAIAALAVAAGASIILGIFGKSSPETFITALYAAPLVKFIGDLIFITKDAISEGNFVGSIVFLIVAPIIVTYAITLWEWVSGKGGGA